MKAYEIRCADKVVGNANVETEGLYYKIRCRCKLPPDKMHRVFLHAAENKIDIGICLPEDGYFVLDKRIPIKHVGHEPFAFYVADPLYRENTKIIPIFEDKPFDEIAHLADSKFAVIDGAPSILIPYEFSSRDSK